MGLFGGVELDEVELRDDVLTLRPWRASDAERVHEIMADASIARFVAVPHPYPPAFATQFTRIIGNQGRHGGDALGCAVVETVSGRLVGSAELRLSGTSGIGYWTAPDARGLGYAARASRLLAQFGFGVGVERIELSCDVGNVASARTALTAGFRFEGVSRRAVVAPGHGGVPDRIADLARFARLRTDDGAPVASAFAPLPDDTRSAAVLNDGIVALRMLAAGDGIDLAEAEDDIATAIGFGGRPPSTAEFIRRAEHAGLDWAVGTTARIAIVDLQTGRVAGVVDLRRAGPPQVGGLGYVVHPDFRGRGYTARALRLLTRWAFADANFVRLELGAKTGNVASQRAARSAGFHPEGVRTGRLRNPDGSFSDEICFALTHPADAAPG